MTLLILHHVVCNAPSQDSMHVWLPQGQPCKWHAHWQEMHCPCRVRALVSVSPCHGKGLQQRGVYMLSLMPAHAARLAAV